MRGSVAALLLCAALLCRCCVGQEGGGVAVDVVFEHARARNTPTGRCPSRPTWLECPLQPLMAGNQQERGIFTQICTPPQDRSPHATSGAENPANRCHGIEHGAFTCGCCGHALFRAEDKCESGTGWPSFSDSIGICIHEEFQDWSNPEGTAHEAVCAHCGAHIGDWIVDDPGFKVGDLFGDGAPGFEPQCYHHETGRAGRFCTDGICLVPPAEGAKLGYSGWCTEQGEGDGARPRRHNQCTAADERTLRAAARGGESGRSLLLAATVDCCE